MEALSNEIINEMDRIINEKKDDFDFVETFTWALNDLKDSFTGIGSSELVIEVLGDPILLRNFYSHLYPNLISELLKIENKLHFAKFELGKIEEKLVEGGDYRFIHVKKNKFWNLNSNREEGSNENIIETLENKLKEKICNFEKQTIYFSQEKKRVQKEVITHLGQEEDISEMETICDPESPGIENNILKFFDKLTIVEATIKEIEDKRAALNGVNGESELEKKMSQIKKHINEFLKKNQVIQTMKSFLAKSLKTREKLLEILDSMSNLLTHEFQKNRLQKTNSLQVDGSESDRSERDQNGRVKFSRTLSQIEKPGAPRSLSVLHVHGNAFSLSSGGDSPKLSRMARLLQTPEQTKKSPKKEENLTNVNSSTECERPTSLLKRKLNFEHYEGSLSKIVENQNGSLLVNESFIQERERKNTNSNCRAISLSESTDTIKRRSMFKEIPAILGKQNENTCIKCSIF